MLFLFWTSHVLSTQISSTDTCSGPQEPAGRDVELHTPFKASPQSCEWAITCAGAVFLPAPAVSEHKLHSERERTTHSRQVTAEETNYSRYFSAPGDSHPTWNTLGFLHALAPAHTHHLCWTTPSTHHLPSFWKTARRSRRLPSSSKQPLGPKKTAVESCVKKYTLTTVTNTNNGSWKFWNGGEVTWRLAEQSLKNTWASNEFKKIEVLRLVFSFSNLLLQRQPLRS